MKFFIKSYSNIMSFIGAIILLVLGTIMFTNPETVILFISYIIGSLLIVFGIFNCFKNYLDIKKDNKVSSTRMIVGIVLIVIGIIFIFLAGVIEFLIRIIIGSYILFNGINHLIYALSIRNKNSNFFVNLILAIILISGGLYIILVSNLAFKIIGLILIIYSIIEIIEYVFNKKTLVNDKETIQEAVLIDKNKKK